MIDLGTLNKNIKEKKESNCYILCGLDEMLMKETIDKLSKNFVDDGLENLNISKFYGDDLSAEKLKDAFETFPFMGEKRVVIIYRIQFLNEKLDNDNKKIYEEIKEYITRPSFLPHERSHIADFYKKIRKQNIVINDVKKKNNKKVIKTKNNKIKNQAKK